MRILAISDIHGMYDKFMALLEKIEYKSGEDELILLGDYIDRGPEPIKTLLKVMELKRSGATVLMGNHEKMLLDAYIQLNTGDHLYSYYSHISNGGSVTWEQLKALSKTERVELIQFINDMPAMAEIDNFMFVHAGIDASRKSGEQELETLLWTRDDFINRNSYIDKTIIFGHTPTKYMGMQWKIWNGKDKIGIDCGAYFGGKLACLELPSMKEFYI